jgi:hypothetical protein
MNISSIFPLASLTTEGREVFSQVVELTKDSSKHAQVMLSGVEVQSAMAWRDRANDFLVSPIQRYLMIRTKYGYF